MLSNLRTIIDARRTNDGSESSHDAAIMDSLIESGGAPGGGGGVVLSSSGGASGGASDGSAGVVDGGGADTVIRRDFPSSQDGGSVFVESREAVGISAAK